MRLWPRASQGPSPQGPALTSTPPASDSFYPRSLKPGRGAFLGRAFGLAAGALRRSLGFGLKNAGRASLALVIFHLGAVKATSAMKNLKRKKELALKIADLDTNDLEKVLAVLPMWLTAPDSERSRWVNVFLGKLWPNLNDAICQIMRTSVEDILRSIVVGKAGISDVVFNQITLGKTAPKIAGIKSSDAIKNSVYLDVDLVWPSDLVATIDVQFFRNMLTTVQVGLDNVLFRGPLRITFGPLVGAFPLFEAVEISFIQPPDIDLNLRAIGSTLAGHLGTLGVIKSGIKKALNDIMLHPKNIHIPIMQLHEAQKIQGILYLKIRNATLNVPHNDFDSEETCEHEGKGVLIESFLSDEEAKTPFYAGPVVVQSGMANFNIAGIVSSSSHVIRNTSQSHVFLRMIYTEPTQYRKRRPDLKYDKMGRRIVDQVAVPIDAIGWLLTQTLDIHSDTFAAEIDMAFYPSEHLCMHVLDEEKDDIISSEKSTRMLDVKATETPAVLMVELVSARGIVANDVSGYSDPYVVITVGRNQYKSKIIYSSNEPVWEQVFTFPLNIVNTNVEAITFDIYDKDFFEDDFYGRVSVKLCDLEGQGMHQQKEFSIVGPDGKEDGSVLTAHLFMFPIVTDENPTHLHFKNVKLDDEETRHLKRFVEEEQILLKNMLGKRSMSRKQVVKDPRMKKRRSFLCCGGTAAAVFDDLYELNESLKSNFPDIIKTGAQRSLNTLRSSKDIIMNAGKSFSDTLTRQNSMTKSVTPRKVSIHKNKTRKNHARTMS